MKKHFATSQLTLGAVLILLGLGTASTARAETHAQKTSETAATSRGLWLEFKLSSSVGYGGTMAIHSYSPVFMIGYKAGRLTVGTELGVAYGVSRYDLADENAKYRNIGFTIIPRLQYDVAQRGPFSFFLSGGAGLSMGWSIQPGSIDMHYRSVALVMHLGFGVRYFVHPRFALGIEAAAHARYQRTENNYLDTTAESDEWGVGLRGAFTAAVVF